MRSRCWPKGSFRIEKIAKKRPLDHLLIDTPLKTRTKPMWCPPFWLTLDIPRLKLRTAKCHGRMCLGCFRRAAKVGLLTPATSAPSCSKVIRCHFNDLKAEVCQELISRRQHTVDVCEARNVLQRPLVCWKTVGSFFGCLGLAFL